LGCFQLDFRFGLPKSNEEKFFVIKFRHTPNFGFSLLRQMVLVLAGNFESSNDQNFQKNTNWNLSQTEIC